MKSNTFNMSLLKQRIKKHYFNKDILLIKKNIVLNNIFFKLKNSFLTKKNIKNFSNIKQNFYKFKFFIKHLKINIKNSNL